jgi:hypothetical protein
LRINKLGLTYHGFTQNLPSYSEAPAAQPLRMHLAARAARDRHGQRVMQNFGLTPGAHEVRLCPAVSTVRRNTLICSERWGVSHEVSSARIFTDKQKSEIWDRWQRGESMSSIGRLFDRASSSIYPLLERSGGIRPPKRSRSRLALTLVDREEISRGLMANQSLRSIARSLRRSTSTISREVSRNGGASQYRASPSDAAA